MKQTLNEKQEKLIRCAFANMNKFSEDAKGLAISSAVGLVGIDNVLKLYKESTYNITGLSERDLPEEMLRNNLEGYLKITKTEKPISRISQMKYLICCRDKPEEIKEYFQPFKVDENFFNELINSINKANRLEHVPSDSRLMRDRKGNFWTRNSDGGIRPCEYE